MTHVTKPNFMSGLFIASHVGADRDGGTPADFDAQCPQVLANLGPRLRPQAWPMSSRSRPIRCTRRISRNPCNTTTSSFPRLSAQHAARDRPAGAEEFLIEVSAVVAS